MWSYAEIAVYGKLAGWRADQLIFVDKSTANKCASNRKFGYVLRGMYYEFRLFKHSKHWSILPVYIVDDFITWEKLVQT